MEKAIETQAVSVKYREAPALEAVSVTIDKGDFVAVLGPNGAGKSTFIKALVRIVPLSAGKIVLFGNDQKQFREWHRIGYLPQNGANVNRLIPATAGEIILSALLIANRSLRLSRRQITEKMEQALARLRISDLRAKNFNSLSGGQQQRVLAARAIAAGPELLLLDEPTAALDPEIREDFFSLVRALNRDEKATILFVTHDTACLGQIVNKVLFLDEKLLFFGTHEEFHTQQNRFFDITPENRCQEV